MTVSRADGISLSRTLIAQSPDVARRRAEQTLAEDPSPRPRATALWLLGMARRELGESDTAHRLLYQAAAVASRAGVPDTAAHARASRLGSMAMRHGTSGMAGTSLGRMSTAVSSARALVPLHLGVAAAQRGRFGSALAGFDTALGEMAGADEQLLCGLLSNRGLALMYSERFGEARHDLERARSIAEERTLTYLHGVTVQNLGCLAVRNGDVPGALSLFAEAAPLVPAARQAALWLDRTDALLTAGMTGQAEHALTEVQRLLPPRGASTSDLTAFSLLRAKIHLARGASEEAGRHAQRVRRWFPSDSMWARLGALLEWAARNGTSHSHALGPVAEEAARGTGIRNNRKAPRPRSRARPHSSVPDVRTGAASAALARCVPTTPLGPLSVAVPNQRHTDALGALALGEHERARSELLRRPADGQPAVAVHHVEAIAQTRTHSQEIASAGAEIAMADGDAAAALEWVEHSRTPGIRPSPCRDREWGGLLERCRSEYTRADDGEGTAPEQLRSTTARLGIAQWHSGCARPSAPPRTVAPLPQEFRRHLRDRVFLCYAHVGGAPVAFTFSNGRSGIHELAPRGEIEDAVAKLVSAARFNAVFPGGAAQRDLTRAAQRVEHALLRPVAAAVGDRPLVIAPAAYAQSLPWGLLPSLRGRDITVVPSGRSWLESLDHCRGARGTALLAAGAGIGGGETEVRSLRRLYPGARVLTGKDATVRTLLEELGGADVAHVAAHGWTPASAPMLSGLSMADGPVFAYDLERLPRVPNLCVLSSCWLGRSVPSDTGSPLGLSSALLALGSATVVAGVLPVRDHDITPAMTRMHGAIHAGATPSRAVADHLADAGFVCFGAGA
ncbi:CHAT domain-containing protein [Haloactinospora alba]|uniref:CHAT domain-containing protein n=1 Tax=Haloactinospora alba TaxID=405555 RepID=A0A543NKF3_9ACTN|nr:CHAT domain-containing protein [Haloactinospora alba]TQN32270.1 CHAT domain-containing protein [Haloactinospora alba]